MECSTFSAIYFARDNSYTVIINFNLGIGFLCLNKIAKFLDTRITRVIAETSCIVNNNHIFSKMRIEYVGQFFVYRRVFITPSRNARGVVSI